MKKIILTLILTSFVTSAQTPFTTSLATFDGTMNSTPMSKLGDWNGDGKADIFVLKNMGAGYRAYLSKGDVWPPYPSSSMQFPDASNGGYYIKFATYPGDVNGDGYQDIIIPAV